MVLSRTVLTVLLAIATVGCGADAAANPIPSGSSAPHDNAVGEDRAATAPDGEDPLQHELLADGSVTNGEMERALLAVVSCVEAGGFTASMTFRPGEGRDFQVSDPQGDHAAADALLEECSDALLSRVEMMYVEEHGPSQEEIARRNAAIVSCLVAEGYDVDGLAIDEVLAAVPENDFAACS